MKIINIKEFLNSLIKFKKTENGYVQFFRYIVVSGLSLFVDFVLLYLFTEFVGLNYLISAIIGYSFGMVVNYLLSIFWVFHTRKYKKKTMIEFTIFVIIGLLGLGLNELLLWFFTEIIMLYYLVSRLISAVIGYTWKFGVRKVILFK